jgi:small subunit ribosomal protein S2
MQKGENKKLKEEIGVEEMFKVGVHYGYSKTRRHPSLTSHIYAVKNKTDIIDLEKTSIQLSKACEFAKELGSKNKTILFVGTKPEAKEIIKEIATSLNMPYINERWIGGTLSNFGEIKKRIAELENYRKENKEGRLERYTKKERVVMAKKMERLSRYYSGLIGLKKLPEALYLVDAKTENIAKMEAKKENIPVIALINSDSDIKKVDYPIVCNDAAIPSIKLFTQAILNSYQNGQMTLPASPSIK